MTKNTVSFFYYHIGNNSARDWYLYPIFFPIFYHIFDFISISYILSYILGFNNPKAYTFPSAWEKFDIGDIPSIQILNLFHAYGA